MATGIIKAEQLSADALTASLPGRDPHPLPTVGEDVALEYKHKLSDRTMIAPVLTSFLCMGPNGEPETSELAPNGFALTDNLLGLHELVRSGRKATLFYLDPPYNTGMDFQSRKLEHSYNDSRGTAAYVEFMRRRLILMREAMAEDGSIYIHIGHHMLAHLKIVMDELFGVQNFRNIITRRKCSSKNFTTNQYSNLNDFILFYTKSKKYKWFQPGQAAPQDWIEKEYPKRDGRGLYKLVPVHAPGTRNGETGGLWKGKMPPPGKHWQYVPSKLDAFDAAGEIHWSRNDNPRRKVYLQADKAIPYTDYWSEFRDAHHQSIAITGYPTEKNLAMLRMIVGASSAPGDLVADPFCGSGTALQAAEELGRQWIGMDESFAAAKATLSRIRHGVSAMGDYVDRTAEDAGEDDPKIVDLFGTPPKKVKAAAAPKKNFKLAANSFFVEEALLDAFGDQVRALASL